jgi:hypothetical protein
MSMNKRRERLWRIDGLPAVRVRAAASVANTPPVWVMLHISLSDFHTAIQPDILEDFRAIPEMRRQEHLRILGDEALARAWRVPGLAFGDIVIPDVTFWVHPLGTLPQGISGVLGLDVLERVGAIVNLRESWLTVFTEEPIPA